MLRRWLPVQLQPAQIVPLGHFPLTAGGKLIRSQLPPPPKVLRVTPSEGRGEELLSETERVVAAAWAASLGVESVGPHDNFWELGGSSVVAVRMLRLLQGSLGSVHGSDAFERGNQRFATRLCGLYR